MAEESVNPCVTTASDAVDAVSIGAILPQPTMGLIQLTPLLEYRVTELEIEVQHLRTLVSRLETRFRRMR